MTTINTQVVRINVTLPKKVWTALEQEIPKRRKSNFIAAAIEDKLRKEKREKAFVELASLPPTFTDIDDSATFIREMRNEEDKERSQKLDV
jgi:transcriptional regulator NrdR family protein